MHQGFESPPLLFASPVCLAVVAQPSCRVAVGGVVVGPVNDTTLRVPHVFTAELHLVASSYPLDAGCDVDVVGDQERHARGQGKDEPLVPRSLVVVCQHFADHACARDSGIS